MSRPTIYHSGEFILLNGDMTERKNLYIEWGKYGGDTYSVNLCFHQTKFLFGNTQWRGLKTVKEVMEVIKELQELSKIKKVRKWDEL